MATRHAVESAGTMPLLRKMLALSWILHKVHKESGLGWWGEEEEARKQKTKPKSTFGSLQVRSVASA